MVTFTIQKTRPRVRALAVMAAGLLVAAGFSVTGPPAGAQAASDHPIGSYEKYPWSSTLYRVGTPYTATAVTYSQWQAAGFPAYQTKLVLGSTVSNYLTNSDEIFIGPFVDDNHPRVDYPHHVTAAEWQAVGSPMPRSEGTGFIKTASSSNVYQCSGAATSYYPHLLSWPEWQSRGTPTPVVVAQITAVCP